MENIQGNCLEIKHLSKAYLEFHLEDVNLVLPRGSIMGLIGANGAGKSTTIKLILNLIRRDSGEITLFGRDNIADEVALKEKIGVVFDECTFHDNLHPMEISRIMSRIYRGWDAECYRRNLDRLGLSAKKTVKEFSRGMKMKLSIAVALSHNPELLILDEPTSGLDPIVRNEILDMFLEFIQDEQKSILLSSHITTDLEKIADYITFIDKGRILLTEEKDALIDSYGVIKGPLDQAQRLGQGEVIGLDLTRHGFEGLVRDRAAMAAKYPDFVVDAANLENMILFLVRGDK